MLHILRYFFKEKYAEYVQLPFAEPESNTIQTVLDGKKYYGSFLQLLYEPQLIGVVFSDTGILFDTVNELTILKNNQTKLISFSVKFSREIVLDKVKILLFEVESAKLHISFLEKIYVRRFYTRALIKNNYVIDFFNPGVFDKLIAFFYYPKPVYLISTLAEGNNSFPVDTCTRVDNHFIFGVRESNKIMNAVKIGNVFAVSLSDFYQKGKIYQLGNYSETTNEITYVEDEQYKLRIPEIVARYQLVRLKEVYRYRKQNVYVGQIISGENIINTAPFLAHIHKFWLLSKQTNDAVLRKTQRLNEI